MRLLLILGAALLLSGCAKERIVFRDVEVPLPVPCKVEIPAKPKLNGDSTSRDSGIFELSQAAGHDLNVLKADNAKLRAALTACAAR